MKALVLKCQMAFEYEERPVPVCRDEDLLVHVDAVCICGSDIHAICGRSPLFSLPRVIGHEVAGTVVQVGSKTMGFSVGDRVCLMPCIPCGHCRACQKGNTNCCESLKLYGVHSDGGLQEFFAAPAGNWMKVPQNVAPEEIAMIEPLTIGAHAVAKLQLKYGDRVIVLGAGPIGVSCAMNAKTYGAEVVLADTNPKRREYAQRAFGILAIDPSCLNTDEEIRAISGGDRFDAVVDTTAVKQVMETDWKWITHGGKIVFVGICNSTLEINGVDFHMREPSLFVTRNSTREDYERVIACWNQGALDPSKWITHTTTLNQASDDLLKWVDPLSGVFKGVVRFPHITE